MGKAGINLGAALVLLVGLLIAGCMIIGASRICSNFTHIWVTKVLLIIFSGAVSAWIPMSFYIETIRTDEEDSSNTNPERDIYRILNNKLRSTVIVGWFLGIIGAIPTVLSESSVLSGAFMGIFLVTFFLTVENITYAINKASRIIEELSCREEK